MKALDKKNLLVLYGGAVNSITGYYSNIDNSEGINRMDSILYGDKSRKIINAFDSAIKLAIAA